MVLSVIGYIPATPKTVWNATMARNLPLMVSTKEGAPAMSKKQTTDENLLISSAKAVGTAAGKIAALAVVTAEAVPTPKTVRPGKLQKKDRHRLPRREKKAK